MQGKQVMPHFVHVVNRREQCCAANSKQCCAAPCKEYYQHCRPAMITMLLWQCSAIIIITRTCYLVGTMVMLTIANMVVLLMHVFPMFQ